MSVEFSLQIFYPSRYYREVWYSAMQKLNLYDVQLNNLIARKHFLNTDVNKKGYFQQNHT